MIVSKYRKRKIEEKKRHAHDLYKRGMTTREVAVLVGKSHTWVANAVKEFTRLDKGA